MMRRIIDESEKWQNINPSMVLPRNVDVSSASHAEGIASSAVHAADSLSESLLPPAPPNLNIVENLGCRAARLSIILRCRFRGFPGEAEGIFGETCKVMPTGYWVRRFTRPEVTWDLYVPLWSGLVVDALLETLRCITVSGVKSLTRAGMAG